MKTSIAQINSRYRLTTTLQQKGDVHAHTCVKCVKNVPKADTLGHEKVPTDSPEPKCYGETLTTLSKRL